MQAKLLSVVLVSFSVVALGTGWGSDSATAKSVSAPEAATIDGAHSSIVFGVKHLDTANFYGRFNKMSGEVALDDKGGSVNVEIDADSIDTGIVGRDNHLKSQEFFSVKEFPKLTFKSTKAEKKGADWEVTGDFTMHGVTKPLTVTVKPTGSGNDPRMGKKVGYESQFKIKRSDFGMTYGVENKALGDDVSVVLSVEAAVKK